MKKYELTSQTIASGGRTLYRIKALRDFGTVKAGNLGGYVESEVNLSHEGMLGFLEMRRFPEMLRFLEILRFTGIPGFLRIKAVNELITEHKSIFL